VALTGRVVHPESPGYTEARTDWDGLYSSYPRVIVFPETTDDVVNAVSWARENEVELRARSGRHSLQGWSNVSDGIVVDVSRMKSARLDPASETVTVGAGLTQGEAVAAVGADGFAVATGGEATVGLAGATLGGGLGLLARNCGLACDNLIAAEIVVASGTDGAELIRVDQRTNADLLWALRGAGNGNFGVVTSFTYRMHPLDEVTFVRARWVGFDDLQVVFAAWQQVAPATDRRLSSVLDVLPDGAELSAVLQSGSREEADTLLAPILSVGEPDVSSRTANWVETFAGLQPPPDSPVALAGNWKFLSQFVTEPYPPEAVELIASYMADAPSPACDYFCLSLGGAVKDEPPGGAAFAHRNALFYAEPGAGWNGDATTEPALAWVAEFGEALRRYANGAYVNVPHPDLTDWGTAYWGGHYPRLREIKAGYDPDDLFSYEQSIRPG
jgi:FAD/FMN-containing dehydrogenase